ncbi:MAG: hypothetical protein H6739_11215 [Alphaproteobacteria bacterium]|nr:hypothetical protein [Alphaproteobacteria bacterium]
MLLLLLACADPSPPAEFSSDPLTLRLVNPTEADPFEGVETLQLDLLVGGAVVVSERFAVDEAVTLPDVTEYGAVTFELRGLSGEAVVSFGRSPVIAVGPYRAIEAPLVFLPVNEALPLTAELASPRAFHSTASLPDGRVLLIGGESLDGTRAFSDVEVYDPATGLFSPLGAYLPAPVAEPAVVEGPEQTLLITGGASPQGATRTPSAAFATLDLVSLEIAVQAEMGAARAGHCFALFRPRFGLALGGTEATDAADYLRADGGDWSWSDFVFEGLDPQGVTGCVTLPDGQVFLQGKSEGSTGVFEYSEETASEIDIREAVQPVGGDPLALSGAMLVPLPGGDAWIGGGLNNDTGLPSVAARRFLAESATLVNTVDPALPRINGRWTAWDDGWLALGCGSPDGSRAGSQTGIELLDVDAGLRGPELALDRARPGCSVDALPDGSLLITGGLGEGADGAIVVPYGS